MDPAVIRYIANIILSVYVIKWIFILPECQYFLREIRRSGNFAGY